MSREPMVTEGGLAAVVLELTSQAGALRASRLVYLQDGTIGFNAAYLALGPAGEELAPVVAYSFSTLQAG